MTARIVLLDEFVKERAAMGPDWTPFRYESLDGPNKPMLITGSVAPIISRGKNKGRRNYKKADPTTIRKVVITRGELLEYEESWSVTTGKCNRCVGTGSVFKSWSKAQGKVYVECAKCSGSGNRCA